MVRLLERCRSQHGKKIVFSDHRRSVKKYAREIEYSRGQEKKKRFYHKRLKQVIKTRGYLLNACCIMSRSGDETSQMWCQEARHYQSLIDKVISQTERRVLKGEKVRAEDKVVSLFEEHTDIIKMAKSRWVYKKPIHFRAGIEANSGNLKDSFGLRRCNWKGWEKFKAYIWSSVVAYNLSLIARLQT